MSVLGIISAMPAVEVADEIRIHLSFGRVIDRLAARFDHTLLCAPLSRGEARVSSDYTLNRQRLELVPQPFYVTSSAALRHPVRITRAYWRTCQRADVIFIRGMVPYVGFLYLAAKRYRRHTCHWIVGDPVALLKSHSRQGRFADALSMLYASQDRAFARLGRWLTNGAFLCNGETLARVYASDCTHPVVSSTIQDDEFFEREDTCQQDPVRLLFVGFVRPEKGVEYLLQAAAQLATDRRWELVVVGARDRYPDYQQRLNALAAHPGLNGRVCWEPYATYGPDLWKHYRQSDVFVFPSLSEGTPRVLVEARANSLPVVSTNVGGIPSSITDGTDGLLVPPKDSRAMAAAIDRVIADGDLRRRLIRNGQQSARKLTVDHFVETAVRALTGKGI